MLLKHAPQTAEIHEGVAFFGRSGQAVLKSIQRLHFMSTRWRSTGRTASSSRGGRRGDARLAGARTACGATKDRRGNGARCAGMPERRRVPLATEVEDGSGEIQRFTPTIDALLTPDVDSSLDEQKTKRAFWEAFKALGPWWSELPPYWQSLRSSPSTTASRVAPRPGPVGGRGVRRARPHTGVLLADLARAPAPGESLRPRRSAAPSSRSSSSPSSSSSPGSTSRPTSSSSRP